MPAVEADGGYEHGRARLDYEAARPSSASRGGLGTSFAPRVAPAAPEDLPRVPSATNCHNSCTVPSCEPPLLRYLPCPPHATRQLFLQAEALHAPRELMAHKTMRLCAPGKVYLEYSR